MRSLNCALPLKLPGVGALWSRCWGSLSNQKLPWQLRIPAIDLARTAVLHPTMRAVTN